MAGMCDLIGTETYRYYYPAFTPTSYLLDT